MERLTPDAIDILRQSDRLCGGGDYRGAMALVEEAYGKACGLGDDAAKLTLGNELLGFYRSFGRFDEAGELCGSLLGLLDSMKGLPAIARATSLLNIGTSLKVLGRFDEAEKCYESSLAAYLEEMAPDDLRLAPLYNNRGLLYRDMGEAEKAKDSFLNADRIDIANGARLESAITRTNLASLLTKSGDLDEAERYAADAIAFFESPEGEGDYHALAAYAARAELLWRSGAPEKAAEEYRNLAVLAQRRGAPERDVQIFFRNAEWLEKRASETERTE